VNKWLLIQNLPTALFTSPLGTKRGSNCKALQQLRFLAPWIRAKDPLSSLSLPWPWKGPVVTVKLANASLLARSLSIKPSTIAMLALSASGFASDGTPAGDTSLSVFVPIRAIVDLTLSLFAAHLQFF
jgi:hypothetical protein